MHEAAGTMNYPGVVWEQCWVHQLCQVLVYIFWPTLYINTVCSLVRVLSVLVWVIFGPVSER